MHAQRSLRTPALITALILALIALVPPVRPQTVQTTTVSGTIYTAAGVPVSGTLQINWPAFSTAAGQAVAAGHTIVAIPDTGLVSVALAPNTGASPAGLYYTAVYHLSDGATSTEYWVVPNTIQATLASVRATVMPAAQAVQAVSKAYVDQSIQQAVTSEITPSGGTLTGPLYLAGDPTSPTEAADKHYVDLTAANALPLAGGTLSGPVTAPQIGAVYQADQFPGSDFGAQLQACINALNPSYGGTCDARNFPGLVSMAANLTIASPNVTVYLPCSTIATAASIIVPAATRNVTLHGCASRGTSAASGTEGGTVLLYSGSSILVEVGDPSFLADTKGFRLDNAALNTTAASSATAQAIAFNRTQEISLSSLYFLGNANQTGLTLDGTGNYTGGTFQDMQFTGYLIAVNAIGHTVDNAATTDWLNASTFLRMHIDCPTTGGNPVTGTTGINLQSGDGNTFTGGDVESCATALHLGAHAVNNTLVGIRNENNATQIQADSGSSYNNWITGGTMFTGKLVDNGTRNSFLDTFHRSFNGLNGDWYGSQQDATVTNHFRLGIGTGSERGLLSRYQTDYGYRWTTGLSDAAAGIQYYQVLDELNNVYRLSIGQYNNGQASNNNQTVLNSAGSGAVILNGSNNAGTGGIVFGSGGPASTTVATIDKSGNAHFTGTLLADQTTQSTGTITVRNNADSEVDYYLWPGATASQKGSFTYKDFNGASQWYMLKDQNNNWALNSAVGGLDSFKAYQSTNSGDTYINAANPTGHIRLNYESGSGAETDIYSGSSASLAAAFLSPASIKLPGLAAAIGHNCLQIDNSGYIGNTGAPCSTVSGSGTVNSGNAGQIAYYTANGTSLSGTSTVPLTAGGTGAATAAAALTNLGALPLAGGTLTGPLTATQFNGPVTGDVTGNVSGHVTGDVSGNLTGNVTGSVSGTAANVTGTVALANGGTGATTSAGALANIGALGMAGGTLTGPLTATQFNGPVNGNVTGNVNGNVTGSLIGNVTGNVTGNVSGTAANVTGTVALANGGTGATTAATALANLGALGLSGGTLTGPLTATQFNGPLTGNVTGSVNGSLAGNVTGNVSGTAANVTGTVAIANGGTGATTAAAALANLGALPLSGGTLTGPLTATQFNGPVSGNLTGNVTGNISGTAANVTGTVALANGGTGATSAAAALTNLGALPAAGGTLTGTVTLKNNTNAEVDYILQPGSTATQKGAFTWKDYNGTAEWYLLKDTSNNLAINSAIGALDSFKAYQSSNSGDTYLDAANSTGHIRLNYETGSGAETDIYSGSSASLDAAFLSPTSIKFPGLAATSGHNCLQIDSTGYLTNTAAPCATGTVNSGTTGQIAYYNAAGTTVSGLTTVPLSSGGTGATTATAALTNLGALPLTGGTLTGALTATQFNGPLSGNVSGNLTGNVTGNVSGTAANVTGTVAVANGGTGATTAAAALTNLGALPLTGGTLTGALTATQFNGPVSGNVSGNLTGNVSGNVTGSVTGNVTGNLTGSVTFPDNSVQTTSQQGALTGAASDSTARTAAATAQTAAATAEADAQTGITNAAKAETDAQTAITNVTKAETDAQTGITNAVAAQTAASAAQATATSAQSAAATAETDAQSAITNAATAQTAANAAQTSANSALNGQANDATARTAASTAETDAQTGMTNAAKAETDAQSGIANAATAETDAQTAITNAATAQTAANAAQTTANSALNGQANDATARTAASSAETDAQTGITNAAKAETDAQSGIANAATAETDAQTAITNAATAQTAANAAQTSANSALNGQANDATSRTAAATAETDAQTAITNAATAQTAANAAQTSANSALNGQANDATARTAATTAQSAAATAETDAQSGIAAAAAAQTTATAAQAAAAAAQAAAAAVQATEEDYDDEMTAVQTASTSALNGQANDSTARTAAAAAQTTADNALAVATAGGGGSSVGALPITGGTLTGPLSGTSASFSGALSAGRITDWSGGSTAYRGQRMVLDYGVTGTAKDVHSPNAADIDDTAALNAAVQDACASNNHLLVLPQLKYRVTIPANGAAIDVPCNNLQVVSPFGTALYSGSADYFGAQILVHGGPGALFRLNKPKQAAIQSIARSGGYVTAVLAPLASGAGGWIANRAVAVTGVTSDSSFNTAANIPIATVSTSGNTLTWFASGADTGTLSNPGGTVIASPDASDYDGAVAGFRLEGVDVRCALDSTQNPMPLDDGKTSYCPGVRAIEDNRGGYIQLFHDDFQFLDYAFYGVQSDIDSFGWNHYCHNHHGVYLGPHSEHFSSYSEDGDWNDNLYTLDTVQDIVFYSLTSVNDGSPNVSPVEVSSTYNDDGQPSGAITFYSPWFENFSVAGPDAFVRVGRNALLTSEGIDINLPVIDGASQTTPPVVTNPGSGYDNTATCTASNGAACSLHVLNGAIFSVSLGSSVGNSVAPAVTISAPASGVQATATTTLSTTRTPYLVTMDRGDNLTITKPKFKTQSCLVDAWLHYTGATKSNAVKVEEGGISCNLLANSGSATQNPWVTLSGDSSTGGGLLLRNNQDQAFHAIKVQAGVTAPQGTNALDINDYTGANIWSLQMTSSDGFQLYDRVNNKIRVSADSTANGHTTLNATGTGAVDLNKSAGTGGACFGDGAGHCVATVNNAGNAALATATIGSAPSPGDISAHVPTTAWVNAAIAAVNASGLPSIGMFYMASSGSATFAVTQNAMKLTRFVITGNPVAVSKILVRTGTVTDAANTTSFAIYSNNGSTRYASTAGQVFGSASANVSIPLAEGMVVLQPGVYLFATASASSTQSFNAVQNFPSTLCGGTGTAPTGGHAPATTTVPADNASVICNSAPGFALSQ